MKSNDSFKTLEENYKCQCEKKAEQLLRFFIGMVDAYPYLLHNRFLKEFNEKVEKYFNGKI